MPLLLIPLDDAIVFPGVTATLPIDTGEEDRVFLLPRQDGDFGPIGVVAEVIERGQLPNGARAATVVGLHRGLAGAAQPTDGEQLRVEVQELHDGNPEDERTNELVREYRAVVEEILELRGADDRIAAFLRSIEEPGALADTAGYSPDLSREQKRKQMESIRNELGEGEEDLIAEYERKIAEAEMPEAVAEQAERELRRLERQGEQSPESSMIRSYLDWLLAVPWSKRSEERLDPEHTRRVLDEDHAGLEDVKRRITEFIAVRKLRQERGVEGESRANGAILTLVGPPGTGKTSIGESVARSLGREFVRLSLGGIHDEAEIRGHRRTYIGALPGRIVRALRDAGTMNPVILLDEVDTIPAPLLDRMEVIGFDGYTTEEKLAIARGYLWPRQMERNGLRPDEVEASDAILRMVVTEYTREAGVRQLERELGKLLRRAATRISSGEAQPPIVLDPDRVIDALGRQRFFQEAVERTAIPGVATGLAVTGAGGDVLFIEATAMEGD